MTTDPNELSPEATEALAAKPAAQFLSFGRARVLHLDELAQDIGDFYPTRKRGYAIEMIVPERLVSALERAPASTTTLTVARTRSGFFVAVATLAVEGMRLALAVPASGSARDWLIEALERNRFTMLLDIDGTRQSCIIDAVCTTRHAERVLRELEVAPAPVSGDDAFEVAEAMANCLAHLGLCAGDATYVRTVNPGIEVAVH